MYKILDGASARPAEEQSQVLEGHIEEEFAAGGGADERAGGTVAEVQGAPAEVPEGMLPFELEIGKMTSLRVRTAPFVLSAATR